MRCEPMSSAYVRRCLVIPRIQTPAESANYRGHSRRQSGSNSAMEDEMLPTVLEQARDVAGWYVPLAHCAARACSSR